VRPSAPPVPFQSPGGRSFNDPQATLQANRATFFFRLVSLPNPRWIAGKKLIGIGARAGEGQYVLLAEGGRGLTSRTHSFNSAAGSLFLMVAAVAVVLAGI